MPHIQAMAAMMKKILAVGLGLSVLLMAGTMARADEPLPLRFDLSENGAFRGNHTNVRHAWGGDCERLLASVRPDEMPPRPLDPNLGGEDWDQKTERRLSAAIEMFDRGLCVERDSERAADLHLFHRFDYGGRHRVSLDYARRLWDGLGVASDREEAKRIMRIVLSWDLLKTRRLDHGDKTWTGHEMPPFGTELWRQLLADTETEQGLIDFAVALLDGDAKGPDGVALPSYSELTARLLESLRRSPNADFTLGMLSLNRRLGETRAKVWWGPVSDAADCWHLEAIEVLIEQDIAAARKSGVPPLSAMGWLWLLADIGHDTVDEIVEISREFGIPSERNAHMETIAIFESRSPYCP